MEDVDRLEEVFDLIRDERARQRESYPDDRNMPDYFWYLILAEEVGEVAKDILEGNPSEVLEEEIVQVAAVAVAWLEDRFIQRTKHEE